MSIVLVGGMDRLGVQYRREAECLGMSLWVFSQAEQCMGITIKNADAVVIFTNKISHRAKNEAMSAAKASGIPCFMHHSCGVCTFRECIRRLQNLDCIAAFREGSNGIGAVNMGKGM